MALDIFLVAFSVSMYVLLLESDVRWRRTYGKRAPDKSSEIEIEEAGGLSKAA